MQNRRHSWWLGIVVLALIGNKLGVPVKVGARSTGETAARSTGERAARSTGETAARSTGETAARSTGETAVQTEDQGALACAAHQNCWNCSTTTGCHWCAGDQQCHAFVSPFGCAIGLDCQDAKECVRREAEFRGLDTGASYAFPTVMFVVIGVGSALLLLSIVALELACRSKSTPLRPPRPGGRKAPAEEMQPRARLSQIEENQEKEEEQENDSVEDAPDSHALRTVLFRGETPVAKTSCCTRKKKVWAAVLCGVSTTLVLVGVLLFAPRTVSYSVCNTRIEWSSVFRSLAHGRVSADVELHLSIFNPNIVGLRVDRFACEIMFKNHVVARGWLMEDTTKDLAAASVTDIVGLVRFAPGARVAVDMWAAHQKNILFLDLTLDLGGDVVLFEKTLHHINTTFSVPEVDVSLPTDRQLCRCPIF